MKVHLETGIHLVIILGTLLMLAGIVAIRHTIAGGLPEALPRLATYAATIGTTIGLATVILDGVGAKVLADQMGRRGCRGARGGAGRGVGQRDQQLRAGGPVQHVVRRRPVHPGRPRHRAR